MGARRTVIGGATVAAIVAAASTAARLPGAQAQRSPGRSSFAVSSTSRIGRITRLCAVAARGITRRTILVARRSVATGERRGELETEYAIRTAADVATELGEMRGVLMKVGQMMSFIVETLPESTRAALASLQESAPPMHPALAAAVINEDLGSHPSELFDTWEATPVAAASIGQVHRAVTTEGDEVAVKVQYPGVRNAIEADLSNSALLYQLVGRWFDSLSTDALVDEFRERIVEELDYRLEAANQSEFADIFAGHPWIRIPRTVPELSSQRVLTSEWIEGDRLADFVGHVPDEVRQRAAEVIWRFAQHSIHRHLMFNGDPHPGNFRFHRDGTVTFLDYGMVKRWKPHEWEQLAHTLRAVVIDREPAMICDAMRVSGFLAPDRPVDHEATAAYVCAAFEPYLVDEFEFTTDWLSDALSRSINIGAVENSVVKTLDIPPSFLILNRVVWGVNALMTKLGARGPFRAMLLEYIDSGEPATPMGHTEAQWRSQHIDGGVDSP